MSHRPWEESAQDPETPNPVTPTKPPRNAGAGQDNSDAENSECQYDSDEPFRKKKKTRVETKKREQHLIVYVPIKPIMRPVTFNCAVFQVSPRQTVHTSSSFPMLLPTTTITTLWSIHVKLALINLLREYSICWCNISELATAMIQPTGVRDSGRAIVVDIV